MAGALSSGCAWTKEVWNGSYIRSIDFVIVIVFFICWLVLQSYTVVVDTFLPLKIGTMLNLITTKQQKKERANIEVYSTSLFANLRNNNQLQKLDHLELRNMFYVMLLNSLKKANCCT